MLGQIRYQQLNKDSTINQLFSFVIYGWGKQLEYKVQLVRGFYLKILYYKM